VFVHSDGVAGPFSCGFPRLAGVCDHLRECSVSAGQEGCSAFAQEETGNVRGFWREAFL